MSLVPCKSCKHQVDSTAKTCPQCGVGEPGVSTVQKLLGLVALAAVIVLVVSMCSRGTDESPNLSTPAALSQPSAEYTILQDETRGTAKRTVEVVLPHRISVESLASIAKEIKSKATKTTDRTFIGYRVDGQTDTSYWATTHYNPDLDVMVQGLSLSDYEALASLPLDGYGRVIGSWLDDGPLGHVKVLYANDDGHFIDSVFVGGGVNTETYVASKLPDGSLRLEEPEAENGEYYIVTADGALQGWSENGNYQTLPPRVPAS